MILRPFLRRAALAVCILASTASGAAWGAGAGRFVEGLGDVPVMPGLEAAGEGALVFDKPAGRIAESLYRGGVERRAVESFYAQTLPQLGWSALGGSRFRRDGEELRLEFVEPTPKTTTVRFVLLPR